MIKIITIVNDLGPGGTQRVAQNFTLGYKKFGYHASILAYNSGGIRKQILEDNQIDVFIGGKQDSDFELSLQDACKWSPNILHIHTSGLYEVRVAEILTYFKKKINNIYIIHTNVFGRVDYTENIHFIDLHLHLSSWSLWKWQNWSNIIKPKPIGVVIPNLVDTDSFFKESDDKVEKFKNQIGIPANAFIFGRIGQPIYSKWSEIIIKAFTKFATNNFNTYLLLVGMPPEFDNLILNLNDDIRKRIVLIPFINGDENLRICYSSIDVFLHASIIGESFGLVLTEALLCETPVITLANLYKDNSHPEVVGHYRGGIVVNNLNEMVRSMNLLYTNSDLRTNLSINGKIWVRENFEIQIVIKKIDVLIKILLSTNGNKSLILDKLKKSRFITEISNKTIYKNISNYDDNFHIAKKLLLNFIHNPYLYKIYNLIKNAK